MAVWTVLTTTVYTIVIGLPAMVVALFSPTGKAFFKMGRLWAWLVLKSNGVRLLASGLEKLDRNASYVFVSNHLSHLDTAAVAVTLPHTLRFVAKMSLSRIPIFGWATRLGKMIFIDRKDSAGAIAALNRAVAGLRDGVCAYFFAEGTRGETGEMRPFKKGGFILAMRARLPVVPVTIIGSNLLLPRGRIGIRRGAIRIIVDDPVDTSSYTEETRDLLLEKVQEVIGRHLKNFHDAVEQH
jgi:1-acyl-sn-glycerol-3-phosphate acyltransferase